ncbi:MAG: fldZ [Clostridium sp.]|jgi:2-enoate reductase|nr:FAD-dependent oxidoreductase [Clostridium sp.]MDF2504113.1 fldZ [Clostridium sp.]
MKLKKEHKILFETVKIGKLEIKNRFAMAPMGPMGLGDSQGGFNQNGIEYYTERAKGGTGLIITGVTQVDNVVENHIGTGFPCATQNPTQFLRTSREMVERIHAYDSKIFLQLGGGFGRVMYTPYKVETVAPSPIKNVWTDVTCREITVDEIKHIVKMFGKAAAIAKNAGFDGVQIHAVHEGYLMDQFATSFYNHRTDEYGGSLENRLRYAREVVEEIKKTCGPDFPVTLRYTLKSFVKDWKEGALPGEEFEEKGRDIEEGIKAAKLLVSYGYDALDVDIGTYDSWWWNHPPMYQKKGLYIPYAKILKENVDVPVICAGRMDNPDMASRAVKDGACDIVSLGRPLLADAYYVNKLRAEKVESIRPCLSCHEGCLGRMFTYVSLNCAVNPEACRENVARLVPALRKKKVLIIGGGVAGCEAARALALRGHEPVIYEKGNRLGGNLIPGGMPDFKEDDHALIRWYEQELDSLNVEIHLNKEMTSEETKKYNADAVIVATGSKPKIFDLGNNKNVFAAADVLNGKVKPGNKTVVVGGGLVGCEISLWLAKKGISVTLVEALNKLLAVNAPSCPANSGMLERLVPFNGVDVLTSSTVTEASENGVTVNKNGTDSKFIECDSVILAVGYNSQRSIYNDLKNEIPEIYLLGDSRKVSNIMYAIWDAYEIASGI